MKQLKIKREIPKELPSIAQMIGQSKSYLEEWSKTTIPSEIAALGHEIASLEAKLTILKREMEKRITAENSTRRAIQNKEFSSAVSKRNHERATREREKIRKFQVSKLEGVEKQAYRKFGILMSDLDEAFDRFLERRKPTKTIKS
jgi:hypothetical protein